MPKSSKCKPRQDEKLRTFSTTNLQIQFDSKAVDTSPDNQYTELSGLHYGVEAFQIQDEGQTELERSPAGGNIDGHGSTKTRINKQDISSDCNGSRVTIEDSDNGPRSVDARTSLILDEKIPAHDEFCNTSLQPSSGYPLLVDYDSVERTLNYQTPGERIKLDAISIPDSSQHDVLQRSDPLHEDILVRSEYLTVSPSAFSHKGQMELNSGVPQLREMLQQPRPGLPSCSSHARQPDIYEPRQQLEQPQQNLDAPLKLDLPSSRDVRQYEEEKGLFQTPLSSPGLKGKLPTPTAQHDNSRECSSIYSYDENRRFVYQYPATDSGDEVIDYNDANPRFRLKITRPSDSILGTVRVNRASTDSKPLAAFDLRDPRDLFTPSSGLEDIFRQVSTHLHAPGAGSSGIHSQIESGQTSILASISNQLSSNPLNPSDEQSFFSDDSSHIYGKRNLRKRLSNLRARVAIPYASKNGAHSYDGAYSYDDISLRDGNCGEVSTLSAVNPKSVYTGAGASGRRRLRERMHARTLRKKVSGWIREAKSVIVARMKPGALGYWRGGEDNVGAARNS